MLFLAGTASAQTAENDVVDFGAPVPLSIVSEDATHEFSVERAISLDPTSPRDDVSRNYGGGYGYDF